MWIKTGYWYYCITLHPIYISLLLCDKFEEEKNNTNVASKKSPKKIYLSNFFQQSSKISEMHRTLNNYLIFSHFLFYTRISNSKYFLLALWSEWFEIQAFMTYHRFVTRLTQRVPLVEQELLTLPVYPVSGVCVTRSLVLCVPFVDRCLSFCIFSFGHCVVWSSIYGFWLPLWYLQTLLSSVRKP